MKLTDTFPRTDRLLGASMSNWVDDCIKEQEEDKKVYAKGIIVHCNNLLRDTDDVSRKKRILTIRKKLLNKLRNL